MRTAKKVVRNKREPTDDIAAHLRKDEQVIWWGRPYPGVVLRACDRFWIPYAGALALALVAFLFIAWRLEIPTVLLVILGGTWLLLVWQPLFGRFWLDAARRRRTRYVITTRRVLIISEPDELVHSVSVDDLNDVIVVDEGGRTSLRLRRPHWVRWWPGAVWPGIDTRPPALELLEEPQGALEAIETARTESGAAGKLRRHHTRSWYWAPQTWASS